MPEGPKASPASAPLLKVRRGRARKFTVLICGSLALVSALLALFAFALARNLSATDWLLSVEGYSSSADPELRLRILGTLLGVYSVGLVAVAMVLRGPRQEWERIMDLALSQRATFNKLMLSSAVVVAATLSLPLLLGFVLKTVVNQRQDSRLFVAYLGLVVLILAVRAFASYTRSASGQALAYRSAADLRHRLFAHLQGLSFGYFDRARQGELLSRLTNDVAVLQNFILNGTEDFFVAPFMVLGGLACIVFLNWQLAAVIFVCAGMLGVAMQWTFRRLKQVNAAAQQEVGALTAQAAEGLNTIRLAQSFGIEQDQLSRFNTANRAALSHLVKHAKLSARLAPFSEALGFAAPLVIIGALGFQAISRGAAIDVGELIAIAGIGAIVANPLGKLSRVLSTLSSGEAASARINELLDTKPEISDREGAQAIGSCEGRITFEAVSLAYAAGQGRALDHVNLLIEPGQVMAFVGESGSGKSSLLHLVPRFYEPSEGRVLLDGVDLRDITLASLRRQIAIVSQDTILIHGTIRENIAYGSPDADEKDILDAAVSANAHNFIVELPGGYAAMVGEKGVTLSGGQRQRIAIARALLRDPRILLLDEATSALDSHAEALVQDALTKLMYGRTTLVVAHRLSTVRNSNRIVVMKNGRIVEQGSHDELLGNPRGEYSRLVKLQGLG